MKRGILIPAIAMLMLSSCSAKGEATAQAEAETSRAETEAQRDTSTVYFIRDINPEALVKIYEALGRPAHGRVGVKISSGESSKTNHLDTALINPLVRLVKGRYIEGNTAYPGNRNSSEKHYRTAVEHGYTGIDIMDSLTTIELPVKDGYHLTKDIVGERFKNYDYILVLSHFKGHQMAGFGGALKNISIGIASSEGKAYIHSAGLTDNPEDDRAFGAEQDAFLESMADACQAITSHMGDNIVYINVANNLSVDCDCNANPAKPEMGDFGILASTDPVALDRACIDMVMNSDDHGKIHLIERINSRHGTHLLDASEKHGIGSQAYKLVEL
ncbi:MAG: DUF362 domain-containing protein [Muribaculaceae bacterium]|nr:DUF362 domain-containing protein [Muribaculaceae bacterium]